MVGTDQECPTGETHELVDGLVPGDRQERLVALESLVDAEEDTGRVGDHRRPLDSLRDQGAFVAPAAGVVALTRLGFRQAGAVQRNRRQPGIAGNLRGEVPDPPYAGEREDA